MEVANSHIKNLRQFVYGLVTTAFAPLATHHFQRIKEWIAESKQALMQHIAHLAVSPIQESKADEQLVACLLATVNLANRTYCILQGGKADHPQQQELLALVLSGLHELIDYAEFECRGQFPKAIPIPTGLLLSRRGSIQRKSEAALRVLAKRDLSPSLRDVLSRYLSEFPLRTDVTFAQEAYHHKLCDSICTWLAGAGDSDESDEDTLHRLLCYFNFNRMDYFDMLWQHFRQLALSSGSYRARLSELQGLSIFRKTLMHGVKWAYDPDRPETVYQHAITLLENAIEQLENEQHIAAKPTTDYLQFSFDQGVWSVLLDMLMEKKHFGEKTSRRSVAYFLAGHYRTGENMSLNPEVLRRSDYPHSSKDIAALASFAEECLDWLKANHPHLF